MPSARAARLAAAEQRQVARDQRASYRPVDTLKSVAADLWVVDGAPLHQAGFPLPLRMTVIRLPSGGLLLHSPTQYRPALLAALQGLGPVTDMVAPNIAHWMMLHDWQAACPDARLWAAPNLLGRRQVERAKLRWEGEITAVLPVAWRPVLEHVIVPGALGFREVAFLHTPSRTAVLTDLIVNLEPGRVPPLWRGPARALGMTAPDGRAPAYVRLLVRAGGRPAMAAAERIVAWAPERVVFAHGTRFDQNAAAALTRSLRWLLPRVD